MSDEIALKVSSRWTEIERDTGLGPPPDRINYLPWGTRSLKLEVTGTFEGQVRICPKPRDSDADRIVSYDKETEGKAIQVSWGGGWEEGVELEHRSGDTNYVYFNVTHQGEETAGTYSLDIVARNEQGHELDRLPVTLLCPSLPQVPMHSRWRAVDTGVQELALRPAMEGTPAHVPFYLSRWWPEAWVSYADPEKVGVPPLIRMRCERNVRDGYSQIEVCAQKDQDSQETPLATIKGDIQFPLVDLRQISADLYHMTGHWALRIWFFWLDKGVARRLNTTSLSEEELEVLRNWGEEQEIPDAERVDLVFDKDLRLRYLCTDLHWHELWAPYEGRGPVTVSIGGKRAWDVTIRGSEVLRAIAAAQARKYVPAPDREFDPSTEVTERLIDPGRVDKGGGSFMHKHTPYFHDVKFDTELISSDVRNG